MQLSLPHPDVLEPGSPPADGPVTLVWDNLSPADWADRLGRVPQSNLLQSFPYALALRRHRQLLARFARIFVDGHEAGICMTAEARVLGLHTVALDRGPLWYAGHAPPGTWRRFFAAFAAEYPRRLGRFRRMMPELADTPEHRDWLGEAGFRLANTRMIGHRSLWLDLTQGDEDLRKGMSKGWRSALAQAERADLGIEIDQTGRMLTWLLALYAEDKAKRGYPGPAPAFMQDLAAAAFAQSDAVILRARKGPEPIAGILLLRHGQSATYQIGVTSESGREKNAHHFLLWRAIAWAKGKAITSLDLGGINPEQAEGVTRFKQGLGGHSYELLPIFR